MARAGNVAAWAGLAALAVALRAASLHSGLIYPDGYQYLLMAKGIGSHLTPTVQLGHGGSLFVPSIDAALKPLFPGLVALVSAAVPAREAADAVTAVSAAATVLFAGLLAARLSGSRVAGAIAAAAVLLSPGLTYWSGFAGPDPLAQALALAAALAVVCGRAGLAGLLGALCIAARPEWALVFVAIALAMMVRPPTRPMAGRALRFGAFTLAGLIGLLRPPLASPAGGLALLALALAAAVLLKLALTWLAASEDRSIGAVVVSAGAVVAVIVSGRFPALSALAREAWPLGLLAAAGLVQACLAGRARPALMLLGAALTLGSTCAFRNPESARYASQLIPLLAVSCGLIATTAPGSRSPLARAAWAACAAAGIAATALLWGPPSPATDTFASLAGRLDHVPPGTLVSAAPDAYGFLLPNRPEQPLRPGARGLILLDAAQRTYEPQITARGVVVARLDPPNGFERPNGTIDMGSALLVRGVAVLRR